MFITISGTPGTGKTTIAKILAKKMNARLIDTVYIVKKYKIKTSLDRKRNSKIIDTKKLAKSVRAEAKDNNVLIFEGHLSHFIKADRSIVLRANPIELERRLKRKGWNKNKIRENIEAEAIGVISSEANGMEIDTTNKSPQKTSHLILKLLKNKPLKMKKIDWTKEYAKYLSKN